MLILASKSPRRQSLFNQLSIPYKVEAPKSDEPDYDQNETPEDFACRCALTKAHDVFLRYPDAVVLGADTIVVIGKTILGKPHSISEAKKMIQFLSGKEHVVITGIAFLQPLKENIVRYEKTRVIFRNLSPEEINWYTQSGDGLDKAGAYGIQGYGAQFITAVDGCYYNVMGFPVRKFYEMLNAILEKEEK